jgi:hypothetical protein
MTKQVVLSYGLVAVLAAGFGAGVAWGVHPDGVPERHFRGVVVNVNGEQTAIGVKTDDGTTYTGLLANGGAPLKPGQTVSGAVYGTYGEVIRVGEVN